MNMSSSFNAGLPSVPSTPASVSPFEQLAYSGLFDDDEGDGSNGSRSRRPSDDADDYFGKLPMHRRAVGSSAASPIADTVTSDTNVLREAINLVQAMQINDTAENGVSLPFDLESDHARRNLAALVRMNQPRQPGFSGSQSALVNHFSFPSTPLSSTYQRLMSATSRQRHVGEWDTTNVYNLDRGSAYHNSINFNHVPQPSAYFFESSRKSNDIGILKRIGNPGSKPGEFDAPHGFCIGAVGEIIVADTNNHRIQIFTKDGRYLWEFGQLGKEEGHFWLPRKVAVLRQNGFFVVCDRGSERSRLQIFDQRGLYVKRIPIVFIEIVAGIAVTSDDMIAIVDSVRPSIYVINPVSGNCNQYIDLKNHVVEPSDIAVFREEFYVCDFRGHSIAVLGSGGELLTKISTQHVSMYPNGIDVSDAGDILVGDSHGNQFHVAIFNRRHELLGHHMCPAIKVSRSCGLKISSEGYIITLAKKNNHVLILDTLYV